MKYIVLLAKLETLGVQVPVIFPDFMVHDEVRESISRQLLTQHSFDSVEAVSGGDINFIGSSFECSGESSTLNLKSRGAEDAKLIQCYNYTQGLL